MTAPAILQRYREIVDDWAGFVDALSTPLPTCLVTNVLRTDAASLATRLAQRGIETRAVAWTDDVLILRERGSPGNRYEYVTGLYNVQEEAAVVPVKILEPRPGERVLDMCAAPGNKTAQLAMELQNTGTVVANDRSAGRHRATRSSLDRLGLANVVLSLHDGTNFPRAAGGFDRVLVDAPCTCEGTSRKQPGVLEARPEHAKFAAVQRGLLRRALEICRPGGRVVYSTCTYAPEENEEVVSDVAADLPFDVDWVDCHAYGFRGAAGITHWNGRALDDRVRLALRVWPHLQNTGGFFVAAFDKSADAPAPPSRAPEQDLEMLEHDARVQPLHDWFGWDLSPWGIFQPNKKTLCVTSQNLQPPGGVGYAGAGLGLLRIGMKVPKPTTAAAMLFGASAAQPGAVVDLTPEQMDRYLHRQDCTAADGGPGYVLVRCEDIIAGVGRMSPGSNAVESLYPGAWALADTASAFEEEK